MVLKAKYLLGLCLLGLGIGSANAVASAPAAVVRAQTAGHELVIIDGAVADSELLRQGLRPGIEVVTLPSGVDPLSQLQTILADHPGLSALHLVSHGASGALQLGSSRLDERALQHHPEVAQALAAAIVPNGDLLLYGCDVAAGAAGQSFIQNLHQQTGLNIAASDNLTGASALGGDWILERQLGRRHAGLAFQPAAEQAYTQVLVTPSDEDFENTGINASSPSATYTASLTDVHGWTLYSSPNSDMGVGDKGTIGAYNLVLPNDKAFYFDSNPSNSSNTFGFKSKDASYFYLNSVELELFDNADPISIRAYKDDQLVSSLLNVDLVTNTTSNTILKYQNTSPYNGVLSIINPASYPVNRIEISTSSPNMLLLDNIDITTPDTTSPTVSSVTVPSNGSYHAGAALNFAIRFDEAVTVDTSGGTPYLALTVGSSAVHANYVSGSGSTTLIFSYPIQAGDNDSDGVAVGVLSANGGTLKDGAGNNATLTLNSVGSTSGVLVDTTAPAVTSVAVPVNSTYVTGEPLNFTIHFDEPVFVYGLPQIALTVGSSTVYASYVSGSGSSAVTFRHTVQSGENDADGITVGTLGLNGGALKDAAANNATLTLNSVGSTSSVLVDAAAPTVTSVAVPSNGTYTTGQSFDFRVNFDDVVNVTGTPRLAVTLGSSGVYASYVSGSGTSSLTLRYTVKAGDNDSDGISVGALSANGGTLKDDNGNNATLTLNSVGSTSSVLVDTTAPTVGSVSVPSAATYIAGQTLNFTVNFNESVTVDTSGGTPRLALTLGSNTVYASYASGSGSAALNFSYTVQAGENDADGITVGALGLNSGTLKDAAGNDATLTLNNVASTSGVRVDATAPTVTDANISISGGSGTGGAFKAGDTVTVTWNNGSGGDNNSDISAVTVNFSAFGGGSAVTASNSAGTWTATYTLTAGAIDATNLNVSATATDNAGNATTTADTTNASVDTQAPTVTDAQLTISGASGAGGAFKVGDTVTATWNNTASGDNNGDISAVTVDFSAFGGSTVTASNSSGTWTASYSLTSGVVDASNRNVSVTATDDAGNNRTTVDTTNASVDNQTPTVSDARISLSGASGTGGAFKAGDTVTATWNNTASGDNNGDISAVSVDFSAFGGGSAVVANNSGGTWTATYTLVAGTIADTNRNVLVTATDNAGNSKTTADTGNASVDNTVPAESSISSPAGGTYITDQNLDFTVNFTDAVTVTGTPRLDLVLDSGTVYASYVSGSGSSALLFRHTVVAGESDTNGIAIGNLSLNSGTIRDAAGNNAQTFNIPIPLNSVRVDAIAPVVNSVAVPTSGTYISGHALDFTVNFDGAVAVSTSGGTPRLELTLGSDTVYANYVSGSGSTALIFSYPIQAGEYDSDGVAVGALSANGGTLKDGAGNDATLTLNNVASTSAVLVDAVAPTLSSSSPADNSTGVAFDANVQLVLSEVISAGSGTLAIYDAAGDSLVEANAVGSSRVTISGNTVTLDPQVNLIPSHSYYLQVGAQALLDAAGNAYAGISDKTTLNFTVANVAPVAQADSASTQEDSAVQVDVTANDSDADSALNKASVTVVTAAQHGTTSVDTGTGVISYTPASNYNGSDSFSYRVQDIYGANSNVVTVSVTVQPVNDAPLAVADIASTTEDTALMVDVLANDSDIDSGDSLNPATLSLVTSPTHGTAQINHGQVSYTPAANYNGSDAFSYTVADQHGAVSNVATVMINVGSSNDAPVAVNDAASMDEDHAVTVDVLANDSDMDGTLVPASVALLQQPAHGQVMLNGATGALVYTPAANYFGQDTFSYAVQDNEGATSNVASVTVTVNSINDAPVATNNSVTLQEDASLSINVLGNDSDVDGTLAPASVQLVSQPAHGTATVSNTDGSVLYTPTSNAVGDDSFTYRVQDDQGAWSNVATVTMTIQSVNDAPLANADQGDLDEDSALTLHLLDNDSDVDGSLQNVHITTQPASGSLDVGSNGAVTYTPAANFHGSDSFSYQAVDNEGALSPFVVVTLTVRAVNDAPTISGNGAATLLEGASYQFAPVINDVDGDELTVTASGLPQWLAINSRTGELSGTPAVGQAGLYDSIVLTVSDGTAQTALPAFALTVQADQDGDGLANSVDADDDNDGMSDVYEDDHGFNPLDPTDATTDADQDGVNNQQESVDGTNPHNASDYLDTTAPVVSAVADVTVDATGRFTPITVRKLLGLADTVSDEEVATELRALSSDNIDGAACCSVTIDGMTDNQLMLAPGRHEVIYQATDRKGNVGTVTQLVRVRPLVSMSKDQVAVPGQSLSFSIILNGPAPDYPFTVPYALDDRSTLSTDQHSLQAGSVTFTSGQTVLTVPVTLGADAAASGNQTLVVRLDDQTSDEQDLAGGYDPAAPDSHDINAGAKRSHVITVTTGNVAPQVDLSLQQNGQQTMLVTPSGGRVTVSATVLDPNTADTHTFDWSGTSAEVVDTDGNLTDAALVFDPAGLAEGVYPVQVTVTDSQGARTVHTLYFRVVASLPELSAESDTDGDGVSDRIEGVADADGDGIVDYLDNLSTSNLLPEALATTEAFVMECDPGVLCRLGQYALQNGTSGSRLLASDLASLPSMRQDSSFTPVGGVFDFEIAELPTAGQSVSVVIPLNEAIPVNAVYRKFQNGQWRTFVEDDNNQLHSAPGSLGYCPPPGDVQWTAGLTAGNYCVQLTLEDGGPNDADGVINASIADPGAVSVAKASIHSGGGAMGWFTLLALGAAWQRRRGALGGRKSAG